MKYALNQRGSSYIVAILAVGVVAGVGVIGYRVVNKPVTTDSTSPLVSNSSTKVPTTIKSKADVRKADAALSTTAVDGSVNPAQLDSDLNSLL